MLLGREAWDTVLRRLMLESDSNCQMNPCVYHERHNPYWLGAKDNPGQLHNRGMALRFLTDRNMISRAVRDDGHPCLIRRDSEWLYASLP
jgi:hypothetical protein